MQNIRMPLNPFSSEFTCKKCDYRSEHFLIVCPACGESAKSEKKREGIPASHLTPTGMYLAPVDPVRSKRIDLRVLEVSKTLCLVFGLITIFLLVPFWLLPTVKGPDAYGYYTLPKGRSQSAPSKVTGAAITNGVIAILLVSSGFFGGYFYLKRKHENKRAEFEAEGRDIAD